MDDYRLFPMYHPAYVNRGAYPMTTYREQFARLARVLSLLGNGCG
jgi:uracil-DNA glycosylase